MFVSVLACAALMIFASHEFPSTNVSAGTVKVLAFVQIPIITIFLDAPGTLITLCGLDELPLALARDWMNEIATISPSHRSVQAECGS
jgi:hypothetical protein